jgi:hypothetical protein
VRRLLGAEDVRSWLVLEGSGVVSYHLGAVASGSHVKGVGVAVFHHLVHFGLSVLLISLFFKVRIVDVGP